MSSIHVQFFLSMLLQPNNFKKCSYIILEFLHRLTIFSLKKRKEKILCIWHTAYVTILSHRGESVEITKYGFMLKKSQGITSSYYYGSRPIQPIKT